MSKIINWSSFADEDFNGIIDYLLTNWDTKVANNFIEHTSHSINQIAIQTKMYPLINKKLGVRKCVLTKHNSLYYREHSDGIDILRIYDNRQDPKKLKFNK